MEKEKLFEIAGEVYRNVPAYIDLARDRDIDIASLTEFGQLPIMEKKYMIDHEMGNIAPEMIREYMTGNLISKRTSGSTGQYLEILWSDADYKRSMIELWLRRGQYYDIYPKDKMLYFYTYNDGNTEYEYYKNTIGINKRLLLEECIEETIEVIKNAKAAWALFQPSVAVLLCAYIKKHYEKSPISFKYVEFSGEVLTETVREAAMQVFGCKVADQYGANEVGSIAYECPYGNKHIMRSNVFIEIVDDAGTVLANSEDLKTAEGNIVITSKTNRTMPFYRYNLGDKVKIKNNSCCCGCSGKIIEVVAGRWNDYAVFEDGYKIHSFIFVEIFDFINKITDGTVKQFYIVQKSYRQFDVMLYVDDEIDGEYIERLFLTKLENEHLKTSEFIFRYTDQLFEVCNGKKYMYFKNQTSKDW